MAKAIGTRLRAQKLPTTAVQADRIVAQSLPVVDRADPPGKHVLCSGEWPLPPHLLLGARRLAWHLAVHPDAPIEVMLLHNLDPADEDAIRRLDVQKSPRPVDLVRGYAALRRAGVGLAQIRDLVPHRKHLPDISTIANLELRLPATTLNAMSRNRRITVGHMKAFLKLPQEAQDNLALTIASAGRPGDAIRTAAKKAQGQEEIPPPDIAHQETEIGLRLGTTVRISAPTKDGAFTVAFDWSMIGDLQGLMLKLGSGPTPSLHRPARTRRLVLELQDNDEYDDLVQHLSVMA